MDISTYTQQGRERLQSDPYSAQTSAAASGRVTAAQLKAAPDSPQNPAAQGPVKTQSAEQAQRGVEGGDVFETVLDTVNPLQHIPGVSSVYQAATGDESNALANMAGGFLFGGPVGLMAGAAQSFLQMVTGKSLMEHAQAFFDGEGEAPTDQGVQTATARSDGPLLGGQVDPALTLQNYQAFAKAAQTNKTGTGARMTEVSWADTIWTDRALKDATGLYQNTQKLGGDATRAATREQQNVVS